MIDIEEKIKCLESATCHYVCIYCAGKTHFETNSAEDFYEHIFNSHPDLQQLSCIFCDLNITAQYYTDHYEQHLAPNRISQAYSCIGCGLQTNLQRRFLNHGCISDSSSNHNCQHCHSNFHSKEALVNHINDFLCVIVECPYPNCMVKSVSMKSIQQHLIRRHEGSSMEAMTSSQLYCNFLGVLARSSNIFPSNISHSVLQNALMSALFGNMTGPGINTMVHKPPTKSCLICPACRDFVSGNDIKFDNHLRECSDNLHADELNYNVFWCRACQSVTSTSRNYVKEHVEESHNGMKAKDLIEVEIKKFCRNQSCNDSALTNSRLSTKRSHDDDVTPTNDLSKRQRLSQLSSDILPEFSPNIIEQVRFPIDYVALRTDYRNRMNEPAFTNMLQTLQKFSAFIIDIVNREGNRRIPRCPECGKIFNYGLSDFKRHLMCVHHGCDRNTARHYLRYLGMETVSSNSDDQSKSSNKLSRDSPNHNNRANSLSLGSKCINSSTENCQNIRLDYSPTVLTKIISNLPIDLQNDLKVKMKIYGSKCVKLDHQSDGKKYYCTDCSYVSSHALADVRKHVLGSHCGISTKQFRFCLQASRLDPINFKLLPEEELLRLANELFKRKQRAIKVSLLSNVDHLDDSPSSSLENNNTIHCVDDSNDFDLSPNDDSTADSFSSYSNLKETTFPLKFSEHVLAKLLSPILSVEQYDSIVSQMNIYASYKITRIENGDRTIAFRCPCNRVFYSDKQSSNGRPSTLADCRRHVLGVHAKIPPQYITVCSQASRMSKETNYELYNDSTLLRYASETPVRNGGSIKISADGDTESHDRIITTPVVSSIRNQNSFTTNSSALKPSESANDHSHSPKNVEREVDLPFSRTALEILLAGICTADLVDELINKMEIYASYRVYVLRVNGKRIYACSGCSSISPHGMTDIRKHILGVHAKIPEKYKNICMQASRLNRDDSSLLSDQNILIMAGVKCKEPAMKSFFSSDISSPAEGSKSASLPSPPVFPEFECPPDSHVEVVNPEPVSDALDINGYYPELSY